jgi:transposase
VHSSDGKRSPGRLSRQGPEMLRWLLFEAAKISARAGAPGCGYYTQIKDSYDANRACKSVHGRGIGACPGLRGS